MEKKNYFLSATFIQYIEAKMSTIFVPCKLLYKRRVSYIFSSLLSLYSSLLQKASLFKTKWIKQHLKKYLITSIFIYVLSHLILRNIFIFKFSSYECCVGQRNKQVSYKLFTFISLFLSMFRPVGITKFNLTISNVTKNNFQKAFSKAHNCMCQL